MSSLLNKIDEHELGLLYLCNLGGEWEGEGQWNEEGQGKAQSTS